MSQTHKDSDVEIDLKRYKKVRRFFFSVLLKTIWWDVILNRPFLRWFRTPPMPRWQAIARDFRNFAIEMGGVLIKLGQFLSIRVDVLPREITRELAGLQDEVPAERPQDIIARIEKDFNRPISKIFKEFSPQPIGAASLAQAHRAIIHSGQDVVVKVLRPGIRVLVKTDLAAIRLALGWLKYYTPISRRVDLDWLIDEFTTVTKNELDLKAEGKNAERLAIDFNDFAGIYIPKVYWEYSAANTLTLENVDYIKIGDLKGIENAGVNRSHIIQKLFDIYVRQVFETNLVHADPHPGNLFIKPMPVQEELEAGITSFYPGDTVGYVKDRPFQIAFVDFGMMVEVPSRMRTAIREYAIGIGTRDAYRVVQSYVNAGTLLKEADLKRLEEAHETLFKHLWGISVGQFKDTALKEARNFLSEFRDVIYDAPFQFQVDMLFIVRAVGILSGMAANLDPNFNPWAMIIPYAKQFAKEEIKKNRLQDTVTVGQLAFKFPNLIDNLLTQTRRGRLTIQTSLAPDARKSIQHVEKSINRLSWTVASSALLISGTIIYVTIPESSLCKIFMILAVMVFLWGRYKI